MLVKNILTAAALVMTVSLSANAELTKRQNDDQDTNPTNYALFDIWDDPIAPTVKCGEAELNIRERNSYYITQPE